jgi:6-phosphogluconolactonase
MKTRRKFICLAVGVAFAKRLSLAARFGGLHPTRLYIGTGGRGPGHGIFTADWNGATGEIGEATLAAEISNPSFLAHHKHGVNSFIYAVSEEGHGKSKVSAFTTIPGQKALKFINDSETLGDGPTHVSVSPSGRSVFVANYAGGSVTSYYVHDDGSLSSPVSHFQYKGSGPYKGRQEAPHTHSALTSLDGKFVLVNDLGLDRIMVYHLNPKSSEMTPCDPPYWSGRPGSGPRHLAWHPTGHFVYCSNELDSTVDTLAWDKKSGVLSTVSSISSLEDGFPANSAFVGEILASHDGKHVYAGNRVANDTIAVFDVTPHEGRLARVQLADGGGKNARHIALDPTQQWLIVSHQDSNDLVVLQRNKLDGKLSSFVHRYVQSKPMCVIFV